jgi:N-methylhydantoinase A/oxoprolinase/acetone carboxylase beta subunit
VEVVDGALKPEHLARLASELGLPYALCEAYPQVLSAAGLPKPEAAKTVRRILEELLAGTGYEFLARLAEDAVRGRRPRADGLSKKQREAAEELGLI